MNHIKAEFWLAALIIVIICAVVVIAVVVTKTAWPLLALLLLAGLKVTSSPAVAVCPKCGHTFNPQDEEE